MSNPHISQLRVHLLDTLADLRNRKTPMEPDRARAIATVGSVLIDSARVEIDYIKVSGQDVSNFIDGAKVPALPPPALPVLEDIPASHYTQGDITRKPGVTTHRLKE